MVSSKAVREGRLYIMLKAPLLIRGRRGVLASGPLGLYIVQTEADDLKAAQKNARLRSKCKG